MHLVPNGDGAAIILFATLLCLSLLGVPSLDAKARKKLGIDAWQGLAAATASVPFWAVLRGRSTFDWRGIGLKRFVLAAILYAVLIIGHADVIGMTPLP